MHAFNIYVTYQLLTIKYSFSDIRSPFSHESSILGCHTGRSVGELLLQTCFTKPDIMWHRQGDCCNIKHSYFKHTICIATE